MRGHSPPFLAGPDPRGYTAPSTPLTTGQVFTTTIGTGSGGTQLGSGNPFEWSNTTSLGSLSFTASDVIGND